MATKTRKSADEFLSYRTLTVRAESINDEERSIEVLLSTENPVPTPDFERREMVPEVLLTEGVVLPGNRQVPLLDSHDRKSTATQLGSIRKLIKTDEGTIGRAVFSSVAAEQWTKVREGHVTDVSAGYQVLERTYIGKGKSQVVSGREYTGPVSVVTKWRLREGSITPIGADEQAKMRGLTFDGSAQPEEMDMNEEFRALCVENGMPKENMGKRIAANVSIAPLTVGDSGADGAETRKLLAADANRQAAPAIDEARLAQLLDERLEARLTAREAKRASFHAEIDALLDLTDLPGERDACRALPTVEKVREHLQEAKKNRVTHIPSMPRVEGSARDNTFKALETSFMLRALGNCMATESAQEKVFPAAQRSKAPEVANLRYRTMFDIAQECLHLDGIDTRGLSRENVAIAAMGFPQQAGVRAAFDPAYHTTGSFPKLTQDAMNKSMMVGYVQFPSTWQKCFRQAQSVPDFKTIHRLRMGGIPNLPQWLDNTDPEQASLADAEETYKVEPHSLAISFSYRLLVNDDMSMISRIPQMFGDAAARTVNADAWAVVTGNPTMGDTVALFSAASGNRKRSNLTATTGNPSVANVQILRNLMQLMRGENTPEQNEGPDVLALEPRFIVGPPNIQTYIQQVVFSTFDPAASQFQTYNPDTSLVPIIEPLLDASSPTAWYLFASPTQIDTVEVTFLQGHESPVVRNWADPKQLSQNAAVLQAFASKAMNHRGMQKHNNA